MELVVWHLEPVERLDRENIEPYSTINEGLGDDHIADHGRAGHWERAGSGRALELVGGVEGDGVFGPPERASCFGLGERGVHLARELLEDAVRGWGLSATQDAGYGARLLEAPNPLVLLVVVVPSW